MSEFGERTLPLKGAGSFTCSFTKTKYELINDRMKNNYLNQILQQFKMAFNNTKKILISSNRTEKEYFKEIWKFRELFFIITMRDISVRYKQTIFGILWAVIRPLLFVFILLLYLVK